MIVDSHICVADVAGWVITPVVWCSEFPPALRKPKRPSQQAAHSITSFSVGPILFHTLIFLRMLGGTPDFIFSFYPLLASFPSAHSPSNSVGPQTDYPSLSLHERTSLLRDSS